MKQIIKVMLIAAMCAGILSAAACSETTDVQPSLSDTDAIPVSISDTAEESGNAETEDDNDIESTPKAEPVFPTNVWADCTAAEHDMVAEGKVSTCSICSYKIDLPAEMWTGYITEKPTKLEVGPMVVTLDEGIYVPGNLESNLKKIINALETVSGLSYTDASISKEPVRMQVSKVEPTPFDGLMSEGELGSAWASSGSDRTLEISSGDLLLGNSYAMLHELSHTLFYSHGNQAYPDMLIEGFAEYNCYKAVKYLEKHEPSLAYAIDNSEACQYNMSINSPEQIYAQEPEYWLENNFPFEYAMNGHYALGFRFMAYLDNVYGDYSKWLLQLNEIGYDEIADTTKRHIEAFTRAYGENVLDGFYEWMQKNEDLFVDIFADSTDYDMTGADSITLYPSFFFQDCCTNLADNGSDVVYNNLFIDLEECKKYLSSYKNRSIDDLELYVEFSEGDEVIELFDVCGNSIGTLTDPYYIELDDVSFVLLKGSGKVSTFEITGYPGYYAESKFE